MLHGSQILHHLNTTWPQQEHISLGHTSNMRQPQLYCFASNQVRKIGARIIQPRSILATRIALKAIIAIWKFRSLLLPQFGLFSATIKLAKSVFISAGVADG